MHAPGRCVPQLISFLKDKVTAEQGDKLTRYMGLVVKRLSGNEQSQSGTEVENGDNQEVTDVQGEKSTSVLLEEGLEAIKRMVLDIRKTKEDS